MNARLIHVYCACDPLLKQVRYVGKTLYVPKQHIRGYTTVARRMRPLYSFNDELFTWLRTLDAQHLLPMVVTLEDVVANEIAIERERLWIRYFTAVGEPLLNKLHCT